ncbi:MAG: glycosyltransferase family 1 protein [bacterium]
MSLTIGIDAGLFPPADHGGLAVYRRELIAALARLPGDHRLIVYGREPPRIEGAAGERVGIRDVGDDWLARVPGGFRQVWLPRAARRDGVDVLHFPLGSGSLMQVAPDVVSVHDLLCVRSSALDYGVRMRGLRFRVRKRWHRRAIPASLVRARRLVASSEATRRDLVELLGVPAERISVAPLAVAPRFRARPSKAEVARFVETRGLRPGYVLGISSIDPRKNAHRLVDAYAELPFALRAAHPLVVLLTQDTYARSLRARAAARGVAHGVAFLPHVRDEELPLVYAGAALLAFPSLFEGFGLPVLEAMALGVPVVASRVGGIPEVGGDAVEYVDPLEPASIAAGVERVLADYPLAELMRDAGPARSASFTWERTAEATLAAYHAALA